MREALIRRIVALILALSAAIAVTGCSETGDISAATAPEPVILPNPTPTYDPTGYRVDGVMAYPDYTFSAPPTTDELRQTAVRAMRDILSVRWSCIDGIFYYKTGPVSEKFFQHQPDTTYAGVLYSNASTGIFQFMEYYDQKSGRLLFPGDGDDIKHVLGSSCADCLIWGWTAVCNSVTGPYYPNTMVYANGYYPVGDYTYDLAITNFNQQPTYKIVEDNGKDVILDAYTRVQPADAFVSTPDNHGMMVIEPPHVVYHADGTINTAESYVRIQDQRGGRGGGFYEQEEDGQILLYSGRTEATFTFDKLLEKSYIPVTTAEFAGIKPYEAPSVSASDPAPGSFRALLDTTVSANYPLAVVNAWLVDMEGNRLLIDRKCFGGAGDNGVAREFILGDLKKLSGFESDPYYLPTLTVQIEVVTSTGVRFIPVIFSI